MYWKDERLNVTGYCDGFIDNSTLEKIWTPQPDVYHKSFIEKIERISGTTDYFSADPSTFHWYLELYVGIQCPFDFSFYPFDTHHCDMVFSSHFHTDQVVQYKSSELVDDSKEVQHALKYDVEYTLTIDDKYLYYYNHSTSGFSVTLTRHLAAAFINQFIPSFMVVMIAFCRYHIIHFRNMA